MHCETMKFWKIIYGKSFLKMQAIFKNIPHPCTEGVF